MTIEFGKPKSDNSLSAPALLVSVDQTTIRDFIAFSDQLPLLVVFSSSAEQSSQALLTSIKQLVEEASGRILALSVDVDSSPELAQAFEVTQLPSVFAMLKGQPAPLFAGNPPKEQIAQVLNRVLEVAKENGLTGSVAIEQKPNEPELSEHHKAAFDAIDRGDYESAIGHYQKQLAQSPNDSLAEAGIAQVGLLIRLAGEDPGRILELVANDAQSILKKADALIAVGKPEDAFALLLELFEKTAKEEREAIRLRILELFLVVGSDDPAVISARRSLSLLLF